LISEFNILICGVGGQGVLTLSRIIASTAVKCGYNVRVGETLGMSQRGGIVQSFVRFGSKVFSPIIPLGGADVVIALDYVEALRTFKYISKRSTILLNSNSIPPLSVVLGEFKLPSIDDVKNAFSSITNFIYILNADEIASKIGLPLASNMVFLGALCKLFPNILPPKLLRESIAENIPKSYIEHNIAIFDYSLSNLNFNGKM